MNSNKYYLFILILFCFSTIDAQNLKELNEIKAQYQRNLELEKLQEQQNINIQDKKDFGVPEQGFIVPYKYESDEDSLDQQGLEKFFGYDFFTRRDSLAFWENLPTPKNYLLGPGDELVISLWGETQLRRTYIISREGEIYDDKIGQLYLMGKTIEEAQSFLLSQFGKVYATLKGGSPSTYLDISIGKLRSININIVGSVKYPGVYPVHPFSNAITALIQAGGVDTTGSLRSIKIKRDSNKTILVDLYEYLLMGNLPKNMQLRDQDVIIVPSRLSTVVIDSAVLRPGVYELKKGETLKELINFAGGLKANASLTIGLKRINKSGDINSVYQNNYFNYVNSNIVPMQDGDSIIVHRIFDSVKEVEIIGQVKKPGKYNFFEGMMLKDLIELASGFDDTTFIKSVYKNRAELVRRNPQERYEYVIEINLDDLIEGKPSANIKLQNLDRFVVHANLNFFEKDNVQIIGEVNVPGSYPLTADNETLNDLLARAGGLTTKSLKNGISIYRKREHYEDNDKIINLSYSATSKDKKLNSNKVRVAWENDQIFLMSGDSVVVRESTGVVTISGFIYNPGLVEYKQGKSLRSYINSSGGIAPDGDKNKIIVIYPNGVVRPKRWYTNPKIIEGSNIIVNKKAIKEPFNITQFVTNWTSIVSSLVTISILTKQLGN